MSTKTERDLFERLGRPARIRQIAGYDLFNPAMRARLDALATRAATRLEAPVSLISILLDSAQLILGGHGVSGWVAQSQGLPAEWSLCARTVLNGKPSFCVSDSSTDAACANSPMLALTGLHSYAGVPLTDDSGQVLGAHCVLDTKPRVFTDDEVAVLTAGAEEAREILAAYRR
jgi:GAF domain-containing protein